MSHAIRLLGAVDMDIENATDAMRTSVQRTRKVALIAYLLLVRRPVRRDALAALLWPAVDVKRARGSLNQLLVELRRELGANAFETRGADMLMISADRFDCDAVSLERAAAAGDHARVLDLYHGPFLDGFTVPGLDRFNDWVDDVRTRLCETVADAATRIAASATDTDIASRALRMAAQLRPYDEAILRMRMSAAAARGNVAEAATMYEMHRARLAEELGLAPAAETRKLLFALCGAAEADVARVDAVRTDAMRTDPFPTGPLHTDDARGRQVGHALRTASANVPKRWRTALFAAAAAVVLCVGATLGLLARHGAIRAHGGAPDSVNVALMTFGDQQQPAVRALPGLLATYLIRDTSINIAYDSTTPGAYQVVANLSADKDDLFGTVKIVRGGAVISATAVRTSVHLGMDTIAAQLARYVTEVIRPIERYPTSALAINAARQHLLFARADFARGVVQNASFELDKATLQLDTVAVARRDASWSAVSDGVARERTWEARGVTTEESAAGY